MAITISKENGKLLSNPHFKIVLTHFLKNDFFHSLHWMLLPSLTWIYVLHREILLKL